MNLPEYPTSGPRLWNTNFRKMSSENPPLYSWLYNPDSLWEDTTKVKHEEKNVSVDTPVGTDDEKSVELANEETPTFDKTPENVDKTPENNEWNEIDLEEKNDNSDMEIDDSADGGIFGQNKSDDEEMMKEIKKPLGVGIKVKPKGPPKIPELPKNYMKIQPENKILQEIKKKSEGKKDLFAQLTSKPKLNKAPPPNSHKKKPLNDLASQLNPENVKKMKDKMKKKPTHQKRVICLIL